MTLPVVLYGCETWRLTLREEHRLMVLENRVLRRIFGLKRAVNSSGEGYVKYYIVTCITKYLGGQIKKNEIGGTCSTYETGEVHPGFWWENLRLRDHLEDPDVDVILILGWIFRKWNWWAQAGLIWLRIEAGGGLL